MKKHQKLIILVSCVLILAGCKQQIQTQYPIKEISIKTDTGILPTPTEAKTETTIKKQEKTYANKKYKYQIKYPQNRFLIKENAENNFSKRGEGEILVGGDLTLANYDIMEKSKNSVGPYSPQKNEIQIDLFIFKVQENTTKENFIKGREMRNMFIPFDYKNKQEIQTIINGKDSILISTTQIESPYIPVQYVFIKKNQNMFVLTYTNNEISNEVSSDIKQIINSLIIE